MKDPGHRKLDDVFPGARSLRRASRRLVLLLPLLLLAWLGLDGGFFVGLLLGLAILLGIGVPAAFGIITGLMFWEGRQLTQRAAGLIGIEIVKSPLRVAYLVRGKDQGHEVRVFRNRVEVSLSQIPFSISLDKTELRAIGREKRPVFARSPGAAAAAREAARKLLALGVTRVVLNALDGRVVAYGGQGLASEVARSAMTLALAPQRIRCKPIVRHEGRGCPYCHGPLGSQVQTPSVRCLGCDTLQHTECWREHGGCAVFRCPKEPGYAELLRSHAETELQAPPPPLPEPDPEVCARIKVKATSEGPSVSAPG